MTISIGGLGPRPETHLDEANVDRVTSSQEKTVSKGPEATLADGTTTSLLSAAASLTSLTQLAMQADEASPGKVDQLGQEIAAGTYKVEPAKIADALLAEWQLHD